MRKTWFLFFLISFLSSYSFIFAQELNIRQFPDNPREGEEVKLTLGSQKYNLNNAKITWTVDGQVVDSGIGRQTHTLTVAKTGGSTIILVTVEEDGFESAQIQKVIEPNTNFVLYEGVDSYVPSFYKGRRLPVKEGTVRVGVFSFKDGNIAGIGSQSTETYEWKVNGESKPNISGLNKILNLIPSRVTDNSLSIEISKEDGNQYRKNTSINIPLQQTETIIYKTDEKKLLKQVLTDTEIGKKIFLLVEPFFFSVNNKKDSKLVYTWKADDLEAKIDTPWSIVYEAKEKKSTQINLKIFNSQKITQEDERGFIFKTE